MSREQGPEDLLVRARREELDAADERRLAVALQSSRELELLYRAGVGFDTEASLVPGDEERMKRLVERTLARKAAHRPTPALERVAPPSMARTAALGVLVGALSFAALASAWQFAEERSWFGLGAAPAKTRGNAHVNLHGDTKRPNLETSESRADAPNPAPPTAVRSDVTQTPAPEKTARTRVPRAETSRSPSTLARPSAQELFARGNAARRASNVDAAIAWYERLCREYPSSAEANDAKILLGKLSLDRNAPGAALQAFRDYQADALSLEALWGQAEALRKLGSPDERAVLERIVREHPSSPYASAARKRLDGRSVEP